MSVYDFLGEFTPSNEEEKKLLAALKRLLGDLDSKIESVCHVEFTPRNLCDMLMANGYWDVIERLKHVEKGTPGYGTVVITDKGFSDDDDTHNAVLGWLNEKKVHIFNPGKEIAILEASCSWKYLHTL